MKRENLQNLTEKAISIAIENKTTDIDKIIKILTDRRKTTRLEYVLNRFIDRRR